MPTEAAIQSVWIWSLIVYVVVVLVVAVMLTLILSTARRIHEGVSAIWTVGQKVANNTIQIPLLHRTNHLVNGILENAGATAVAVGAVEQHAAACPYCPGCVTGVRKGGSR
jgi:hypothetical protein